MLWLNTTDGSVIESPNRPSPVWVKIVQVEIGDSVVDSTLSGLRRAMSESATKPVLRNDIEDKGKTGLDIYSNEAYWKGEIEKAQFPYITTKIASDGILEIRYDEDAKDDSTKDSIHTKGVTKGESPLKRRGGIRQERTPK